MDTGVLADYGPVGIVAVVLLFLLRALSSGALIPRASHERELDLVEGQVQDWKTVASEEREVRRLLAEATQELLEAAALSASSLAAIRAAAASSREAEG